ncbi:MAG TPA: sugar phosphate isomerase/epimerase family protein [Anaerolineae bacterium]|nr:sugar phosphate isomerase/epimerase family protein [Anaerolineae bacterium]
MLLGLHTGTILHTNVMTDVRVARETGYDAIELTVPKLVRYLDAGYGAEELLGALGNLKLTMLNSFLHIERQGVESRCELREQCERLCRVAQALGCPTVQVVALNGLRDDPWAEVRCKVGRSLTELADIAVRYGVRLALEPVTFTPLRTLSQALEVLDVAARDNVGLCLDTFHLWTGGTSWEEVAVLDPALIAVAHISDVMPRQGAEWSDADRDVLPGDGILPLADGIAAIRATGYDDVWCVEMMGDHHWEWDPFVLAKELEVRARRLLSR